MPVVRKNPIGIVPEFIVRERRADEIILALARYQAAGFWPPAEWAEELAGHLRQIAARDAAAEEARR